MTATYGAPISQLPRPASNQRIACIGPTGCGKSVLMRMLLSRFDNAIVIDPKHQWIWDLPGKRYSHYAGSFKELVRILLEIERDGTGAPVVYRPPFDDLQQRNIARLDRVYELAFSRGHTHVYMDEQYFATPYTSSERATNAMPYWFRCITAGRSRGVGVSAAFQRTTNVPLITMSETDLRIAFYLRMKSDRERAEELCGPINWESLQRTPHGFVWATDLYSSTPMRLRSPQPQVLTA